MTDEQILELVKEHFIEWEADEDGYCWVEFAGKPDDFLKFARVMYDEGYNAAQKDYKVGEFQEPEEEPEELMEKLGFVKNSDGNWTAQPLVETAQERGERVHNEMEETIKIHDGYGVVDYKPTPQTPEETEKSLKEAFVKAQQTEKWKEIQKLIDEEDSDKNFKNSLDLIKEWGEKNKPPTLYQLIEEWWCDVFCANSTDDMETCIDSLVEKIDEQFIPPSSKKNGYEWEKCLKIMRDKLR